MMSNVLTVSPDDILDHIKLACQIPNVLESIATKKLLNRKRKRQVFKLVQKNCNARQIACVQPTNCSKQKIPGRGQKNIIFLQTTLKQQPKPTFSQPNQQIIYLQTKLNNFFMHTNSITLQQSLMKLYQMMKIQRQNYFMRCKKGKLVFNKSPVNTFKIPKYAGLEDIKEYVYALILDRRLQQPSLLLIPHKFSSQ